MRSGSRTSGSTAYNYGNSFRDITWEVCDGGFLKLLGQYGGTLDNLISYDATLSRDGYAFGLGGTGKLPCWGLQIAGLVRLNPQVLADGVVDINCASLARGVITACNGTIDLSAKDVLAENLLYDSSPPTVLENSTGATEHSAIRGSLVRPPVTPVTASYQATVSDSVIVADAASGGFTVTLPSVAGLSREAVHDQEGRCFERPGEGGGVRLAANRRLLHPEPDRELRSLTVVCDGSAWQVI